MSLCARAVVPAREFPFDAHPDAVTDHRVILEEVVPTGDLFIPYLRFTTNDEEEIELHLGGASGIDGYEILEHNGGETLVRVHWNGASIGIFDGIQQANGAILEAEREGADWHLLIRFDNRQDLTTCLKTFTDQDISFRIIQIKNSGFHVDQPAVRLTDVQRETIETAFEKGYFDVPRRITLKELAAEMGVSDSAISQRLRRAYHTMIRSAVIPSSDR